MAKGLRATSKKNNRLKIRSRVYAPVDEARTERLSQRLLDLASQPKPAKTEMDVDAEKEASNKDQDAPATTEGLSFRLSCPIPVSLSDSEGGSDSGEEKHRDLEAAGDDMFYHLLGLCTDIDIDGFGEGGELLMDLDTESFSCFS
ncbi:hypothetical protein E6O75_ATG08907 [Venturia nashicola]|uniref:DUF2423 domain-containing protein n=1 Tax=Venturia nashicola TaxID=86259 RepID=A0A4Z1NXB9_9PEZI|nr:hypothetical protein E6O75_ATG08907 [Venturia nashicola]